MVPPASRGVYRSFPRLPSRNSNWCPVRERSGNRPLHDLRRKTQSRCDLTTMDPRTLAELRQSRCELLKKWPANQHLFAREAATPPRPELAKASGVEAPEQQ